MCSEKSRLPELGLEVQASFENGFNAVPWCCLHTTLKKIKGAAHNNSDVDGTCKRGLN